MCERRTYRKEADMNMPSKRTYSASGKRIPAVMPPQPTVISRKTAGSLAYLEGKGLADFSNCKLKVFVVRGPRNHRQGRLAAFQNYPNRLAV